VSLLIAGWVAIDDIETPFGARPEILGGSATPAAIAASLFTDVRLLATVGEDFPREYLGAFAGRRIDLEGPRTAPGETSRWGCTYGFDMNTRDTRYSVLGVNEGWAPSLPAAWEDTSAALLAALDPGLQLRLIEGLPASRVSLVDTIKFYLESAPAAVRTAMAAADMVCINDIEARELVRTASIAGAARQLVADGTPNVIIKLGEYGAAYANGEGDFFIAPGYPLENVIDPTGAGDAFAGGMMGYLDTVDDISAAEIRRAIVYGSTVASFQVEGFGVERLLTVTQNEVEARFREFRRLTHFELGA